MTRYLHHTLTQGCSNLNGPIAKVLGLSLMAAGAARASDVGRLRDDPYDHCLQYKDILLTIKERQSVATADDTAPDTREDLFARVVARVTLRFTEGQRNTNDNFVFYIAPLMDPALNAACPVCWLFIHALRHGHFEATGEGNTATGEDNAAMSKGNTATTESSTATGEGNAATSEGNTAKGDGNTATDEGNTATTESSTATKGNAATIDVVLATANARADKTIRWRFPDLAVLPSIASARGTLDFGRSATGKRIMKDVEEVANIAGILARVTLKAFKLGAVFDYTHRANSHIAGAISYEIAQAIGHKYNTMVEGTTGQYTGHSDETLWNERAQLQVTSILTLKVTNNAIPSSKVTVKEMEEYAKRNGMDCGSGMDFSTPISKDRRHRIRYHIRKERIEAWRKA